MGSGFDSGLSEAEQNRMTGPTVVESVVGAFTDRMEDEEDVTSRIVTVPNIISLVRLCMIPVFFVLLLRGCDVAAAVVFAVAALSDSLDGYIARTTHTISKLGKILDPFVDRLLMASGAVGLVVVGRVPAWIVILILARDVVLLCGGAWLLKNKGVRIPVIFVGKVVTTLLFSGFAFLLINWPRATGLGLVGVSWLPGFNAASYSLGIWFVYVGLVLGLFTTAYYVIKSAQALHEVNTQQRNMTSTV